MACVDCKDNIINKTPSIIGEPKCGSDCPPETTCTDGYIASTCIYYSGSNLACTGINYGDTLSEVIQKLDSKYGVRVTSADTCCGYLFDKIVSDSLTKTVVVENGCQKLKLEACNQLEWINIELNSPYTFCELPPPAQFQSPQYAIDPCNGKVWLRGTICIPAENSTDLVFTIPNLPPLYIRQYYNVIYEDGNQKRLIGSSNGTDAEFYINNASENGYSGQILLDGLSYEIN